VAWQDDEAVPVCVNLGEAVKRNLDAAEAGVVCALAEERNELLLLDAGTICELVKPLVRIAEGALVFVRALLARGHPG
jgi:hypothetical protein